MSDYISLEIQAEIMKWFPVKSLIRFRSVSKPWKALIESRQFISEYYLLHKAQQQNHHLLIRYTDPQNSEKKCVSVVDNNTFPLHKYPITIPASVKYFRSPIPVIAQGLVCFYNSYGNKTINGTYIAIIWNPLINKSVDIELPYVLDWPFHTAVVFWVCPKTSEIKLVAVTYSSLDEDFDVIEFVPWQVDVFTLSSGVWRRPLCSNLPRNSIEPAGDQVHFDGVIYWLAIDPMIVEDELIWFNLLMVFDTISEEFTEVSLPDNLASAHGRHVGIDISRLRESLVVFENHREVGKQICKVWIMEHGDPISFTNLFTINMTEASIASVVGFMWSGELVIVMKENDSSDHHVSLYVYEPYSKNISSYADICAKRDPFDVSFYHETLLLLDQ